MILKACAHRVLIQLVRLCLFLSAKLNRSLLVAAALSAKPPPHPPAGPSPENQRIDGFGATSQHTRIFKGTQHEPWQSPIPITHYIIQVVISCSVFLSICFSIIGTIYVCMFWSISPTRAKLGMGLGALD